MTVTPDRGSLGVRYVQNFGQGQHWIATRRGHGSHGPSIILLKLPDNRLVRRHQDQLRIRKGGAEQSTASEPAGGETESTTAESPTLDSEVHCHGLQRCHQRKRLLHLACSACTHCILNLLLHSRPPHEHPSECLHPAHSGVTFVQLKQYGSSRIEQLPVRPTADILGARTSPCVWMNTVARSAKPLLAGCTFLKPFLTICTACPSAHLAGQPFLTYSRTVASVGSSLVQAWICRAVMGESSATLSNKSAQSGPVCAEA